MVTGDWEQQSLHRKVALPIPPLAEIGHGHITVKQAKQYLPDDIWTNYQKIAFVRNPYDRFVSACAFMTRGAPEFADHPTAWMKVAIAREQFRQRVLIKPQYELLVDQDDEIRLDHLGRYESLQESLDGVFTSLGLEAVSLKQRNASKRQAGKQTYQSYYDEELGDLVRRFYAADLKHFDYQF